MRMVIKEVADPRALASTEGEKIGSANASLTAHLSLLDYATFGIIALLTLLLIFFHGGISFWPWLILANVSGVTLIWAFAWFVDNRSDSKILGFLRASYPIFLYTFIFKEVSFVLQQIFPFWMEPWLIQWDLWLFGVNPTVWVQSLFRPWLTELMAFSYWSYYVFIPFVGVFLYLRDRAAFHSYVFRLSLTFYVCYLFFLVLTARSPHETLAHLHHDRELIGFFDHFVDVIQRSASISGAAFPSSHVAAQWVAWLSLFKVNGALGWISLPVVIALTLSVVYMQYHYAVDAVAGILILGLSLPLARALEDRFASRRALPRS